MKYIKTHPPGARYPRLNWFPLRSAVLEPYFHLNIFFIEENLKNLGIYLFTSALTRIHLDRRL